MGCFYSSRSEWEKDKNFTTAAKLRCLTFNWSSQVSFSDVIVFDKKRAVFVTLANPFGEDGDVGFHHFHRAAVFDVRPTEWAHSNCLEEDPLKENEGNSATLTVPAEYSVKCCILLRVKVFCCNNHWKMSDLEGKKNKQPLNKNIWHTVRAALRLVRDLKRNTVPCLVPWVPGPRLWWCSTKFDRTDQTQRCESSGCPVSGSTFWAGPASGLSSQRGSTTPTVCLRSHLFLVRIQRKLLKYEP